MAAMTLANQPPPAMGAPVYTNNMPPSALPHFQPVAPPSTMPTIPMMPTQQPPPILQPANPVPTFVAPNLPTVMSTSVATYQPATLVATESPSVPPVINPVSNSYVTAATPSTGVPYQTATPVVVNGNNAPSLVQPVVNSGSVEASPQPIDPNVILAKPVPLLTDITLNATPTMIPADQTVQLT